MHKTIDAVTGEDDKHGNDEYRDDDVAKRRLVRRLVVCSFAKELSDSPGARPRRHGGEAGVHAASGSSSSYSFEKIVTREIFPDLETMRTAFGDEQVQQSIKKRHWQLSIFMITGVQIAYGAEVLLNQARERGVYLQTGVDLTAATGGVAPVSVGAGLDTSSTSSQSLSTKYQSPFVFAYRLRQIMYRRKVEKQRDDTKGNLLGLRDGDEDPRSSTDVGNGVYEVQFAGLDQEDEEVPEIFDLGTEDIAAPEGDIGESYFRSHRMLTVMMSKMASTPRQCTTRMLLDSQICRSSWQTFSRGLDSEEAFQTK
ncbi:Ankyrin repeat protein [Apiospora rasikravindrae]|uniref:Ankyrin repeat protein n=1 Tax=Apiospora rasikravindrae TaxID=990691 RepID=A0ABR1TEH9_9PEZI